MDGTLCARCAIKLRREVAVALARTNHIRVWPTAYLQGSGRLWFWDSQRRLVVSNSIYGQMREWFMTIRA